MGARPTSGSIEPLGLTTSPLPSPTEHLDALHFEFSSRGDRVPGRLLRLPPSLPRRLPLVLLEHDLGGAKEDTTLDRIAVSWARRGVAIASIDLPLHGERSDAKLAALLRDTLREAPASSAGQALLETALEQAAVDLRRALDACAALEEIDASRIVYTGLGLGGIAGAAFCAADPRPRAVVLGRCGAGLGPAGADPAHHVALLAPRPLLLVNATADPSVPRPAGEALFAAAGEPREILWFEGRADPLPDAAIETMWRFLAPHLETGEAAPSG